MPGRVPQVGYLPALRSLLSLRLDVGQGSGGGGGRARQAVPDPSAPALDRSHAVVALEATVRPTEQAVELPGELFWIVTVVALACGLGFADGTLQAVRPAVLFLQH